MSTERHPADRIVSNPYRKTYRCRACWTEKAVTLSGDWRERVATGEPLVEQRCPACGGIMELVRAPLDP